MKPIVIIICILTFTPISDARDYIFQLQSGYTLKVVTPDDTDFLQAINSGLSINVTITSSNPQQEQLDYSAGHLLLAHLLTEAMALYHEDAKDQVLHSATVVVSTPYAVEFPVSQSAQVSSQGVSGSTVANPPTQRKPRQVARSVQIDPQGGTFYTCVFPDCGKTFSNHRYRSFHHKEHFSDGFFTGKEVQKACPLCGIYYANSFATMMIHISLSHRKK